ncbi:S1 family peptidase [Kribbella deserti]|uniref:S1 family peptidase n=1 Tax=Kribbella deserti TaxID=1926257 RepID=A0ABV6QQQ6_9ACTN
MTVRSQRLRFGAISFAGIVALVSAGLVVANGAQANQTADPVVPSIPGVDKLQQRTLRAVGLEKQLGGKTLGSYIDKSTGRIVVAVSDAASADTVRRAGAVPKLVKYTAAQLGSVKTRLDRLATTSNPGQVRSWYVDPASGTVVVKVTAGAKDAATQQFLRQVKAHGAKVSVKPAYGKVRTTADLLGGHQVNMSNGYLCSLGFNAKTSNGTRIFITAGHCTDGRPSFSRNGVAIGTTRSSSFPGNDYGAVNITSTSWTQRGLVERWSGTDVPVRGRSDAPVGSPLCKSGRTTHWTCGVIVARNVSVNYGGGEVVSGLYEHTACVEGGDSGGANLSGNYAQGVTSGAGLIGGLCLEKYGQQNESFSQPIGEALSASGASLVLG